VAIERIIADQKEKVPASPTRRPGPKVHGNRETHSKFFGIQDTADVKQPKKWDTAVQITDDAKYVVTDDLWQVEMCENLMRKSRLEVKFFNWRKRLQYIC
jgi:hypothetical protein